MRNNGSDIHQKILKVSFWVMIVSLAFMRPSFRLGGMFLPLTDIIFPVITLIWLVSVARRKIRIIYDPIYFLFAAYAAGMLLSVIFSENRSVSSIKFVGELYLIGLAVLTINVVKSFDDIRKTAYVWIFAATIPALIGTFTVICFYLGVSNTITKIALHHYGSLPAGNFPRIQSTFEYPAMLCNYFTVALMMLLVSRHAKAISSVTFAVLVILFVITIIFTVTPGIGGVLLAIGMWFWLSNSKAQPVISKASLVAGITAALAFFLVSTVTFFPDQSSPYHFVPQRYLTWESAFRTFLEHPIFGKGLGLGVAEVYFSPPAGGYQLLTDAHNIFISVGAQSGVLSLISLCAIIFVSLKRSLPIRINSDGAAMQAGSTIAFVCAFIYQGMLGSFEDSRHIWVLIGLLVAASRLNKSDVNAELDA